jgi:hypothetical protein
MNQNQINKLANGWALFETNDGLRIQKDDESGRFASDDNVLEYLAESAESGSQLHAAALAHHYASIAGLAVDSSGVIDAALGVIDAWESGDLAAAAVRSLDEALANL